MTQRKCRPEIQAVEHAVGCACQTGTPDLRSVAKAMRMSPRSLQRLLMQQGTSFSQLLERDRRQKAVQLLVKEDLAMSEIARMLGYSDPSNFGRAVRKWTGQSPKQLRVRLLRERRQGIPNRGS